MKMAVVGPAYPFRGGIAHYTTLLTSYLAAEHDTRLYSFKRLYPAGLYPGRSQIDPSGKPVAEVEARRWLTPWWPLSWRRVTRDWKTWQPDRVVVQWWVPFMAPQTVWLLKRARQLRVHSTLLCHNVLPHERSRTDALIVKQVLRRADRLIVHTQAEYERARALLPDKPIVVSPHPTYAELPTNKWTRESARAELKIDGKVLLFFGLVRPYKGLLDLIEALPAVLAEMNVTLLVVGEIWGDAAIYHARVNELGLRDKVRFIDRYVSNDEVALYFSTADLVALPYREATGSGVLQVALGAGVPVVATRTGGMDEVVRDGVTGYLIDPGDIAGLSRAVVRYFREDRSGEFRRNIQSGQAAFEWPQLVRVIAAPDQGVAA
jgi:glycosyltransferase involved in cell wall biosynthesis